MSNLEQETGDLQLHSQETELEILKCLAPMITNRVVLDVGASTGVFASYFASMGWEVHAFEPCPEVFAKLSAHLANMPNARCYPLALSDREGSATLHIAVRSDGTLMDIYHTLVPYEPTPEFRWGGIDEVRCLRLDSACASLGITRRPGLLKIDTEGNDYQVLKGLGELLPEVIMVEFWDDAHPFGRCPSPPHLMLEFLRQRGYQDYFFITRNGEEELLQINTSHLRPGDWGNIIIVHESAKDLFHALPPQAVLRSQQHLLSLVKMYRTAAKERLEAIQQLDQALGRERAEWARERQELSEELRREKLEELDRTLSQERAEWTKGQHVLSEELRALQSEYEAILKSPIHYFREVWQRRTNKRRDESG